MGNISQNVTPEYREYKPNTDIMWGTILAGVIAYDIFGEQTLSQRFDEYLEHPIGRYLAIGAVVVTASHLLNLPEAFGIPDPIITINNLILKAVHNGV